jgi:lysine 2,3-aminomutase
MQSTSAQNAGFVVADDEPPLSASDAVSQSDEIPRQRATWYDWRWQMRHRLRSVEQLKAYVPAYTPSPETLAAARTYRMGITPYYASLIERADASDPIFSMSVPQGDELYNPPFLRNDPLEEDHDMPVPGLVHRYGDRALLVVTSTCAMYCRHCTRKRVTSGAESIMTGAHLDAAVAYLQAHPEIHDVIISGGDPLTMSTSVLERIIAAVRRVPSVDIIRLGSRTPVTMPMRITRELVAMLRKYHPIWINTHFNHPREITPEAIMACTRLVDAGIPLGNQTVLLRGVNDRPQIMEELCRGLVRMRVRPYYLFQCDLVPGVEHFRTPIARGIEIMEYLRGRLSGLAIPLYVVDAPGGGGKIPVLPNYLISSSPTHTVFRNFEGLLVSYPEPQLNGGDTAAEPMAQGDSVWSLSSGRAGVIRPATSARHQRREEHSARHQLSEPWV